MLNADGLLRPGSGALPSLMQEAMSEAAAAAKAQLGTRRIKSSEWVSKWVDAHFQQTTWSGPVLSERAAMALWGRREFLRSAPRYRLGDLIVMRDKGALDLSPLGPPSAQLGRKVDVLLRELSKPNTGLRLRSVQKYHPRVKTFADQLARVLGTKVNVNGYASLSRGTIFAEHWDAHDVTMLQVHGTKRWRVRRNAMPMPLACHRELLKAPRRGDRQTTFHLTPGTLLFLPRGHWHQGEGDESIHLTFGLPEDTIALRIADVTQKTLARHLSMSKYRVSMSMFDPSSALAHAALRDAFEHYVNDLRSALLDVRQSRSRPAFFGRPPSALDR